MTVPRAVHEATVLLDGSVLLTGGCTLPGCEGFERGTTSEVYDPVARRFTRAGSMTRPRAGHTATLLSDGRVLVVGGYPGEGRRALAAAEVYDPADRVFRAVGSLTVGRADHSATVLPDGRVLVAGGTSGDGAALASTEVFDPATLRFGPGRPLSASRAGHVAAVAAGRVVLVGGTADLDTALPTTDVLEDGRWAPGPTLRQARVKHGVAALPDGEVLVVGGATTTEGRDLLATTELLGLDDRRSRPGPVLSEGQYKLDGALATLGDGRVVVAGGRQVEVFDPVTGQMAVVPGPAVPRRSFVSASVVGATTVLVAGGYDSAVAPTADARLVRVTRTPVAAPVAAGLRSGTAARPPLAGGP